MKNSLYKRLYLSLLFTMVWLAGLAQSRTITGRITDEAGAGLPGVNIVIVGSRGGATTDAEGNYRLSVPSSDSKVRISYIGYTSQERTVGAGNTLDVQLAADATSLNEVVVLAFGEQAERRNLSGAVASVKGRELAAIPSPSVEQLLQGRAAGVQITSNSGAPGGGLTVRVRGTTSITADNQPLYVVDGIPIRTENIGNPLSDGSQVSPISDINPNDIESIEVLKDASTAAIYGARAANGVVLVRTKRGKGGKAQIDLNAQQGVSYAPPKLPLMNATQWKAYAAEYNLQTGRNENGGTLNAFGPERFQFGWYPNEIRSTDWQELIRRDGPYGSYSAGVRGGNANSVLYNVSGGYFNELGTLLGSDFERLNGRVNLDMFPSDRLQISTSINVANSNRKVLNRGTFFDDPLQMAFSRTPDLQNYIVNPTTGEPTGVLYGESGYNRRNPYIIATQFLNQERQFRTFGNVTATYWLIKNALSVKANYGIDYTDARQRQFQGLFGTNNGLDLNRRATQQNLGNLTWFQDIYANYNKQIGKGELQALVAFSQQQSTNTRLYALGEGSPTDQPGGSFIGTSSVISRWASGEVPSGLASLSAKASYTYDDFFSVSGLIKRESSSRFPASTRVGYFPAFSGFLRLSKLPAFQNLSAYISELKLRGSWGVTGNQNGVPDFTYLRAYGSVGTTYLNNASVTSLLIPNDNLKWETTRTTNIGLDLGLLNGRLFVSADYYVKNTDDLLLPVNLPTTSGFASYVGNVGATRNSGVEFSIQGDVLQRKDFRWTTNFNIATNTNVLVSSSSGDDLRAFSGGGGGYLGIGRVGQPLGTWYGYQAAGVLPRDTDAQLVQIGQRGDGSPLYSTLFQTPGGTVARDASGNPLYLTTSNRRFVGGDMLFQDTNQDGRIDETDFVVIGRAQPKLYGGFSNTFAYRNLSLDLFFQYQYGNDVVNGTRQYLERTDFTDNQLVSVLRSWRTQGDITDIPRVGDVVAGGQSSGLNAFQNSSRWVEDGSYLRLKSVTLGYALPKSVLNRVGFNNVRVYVSGFNILTFTRYKGLDPEFNNVSNANNSALLLGLDYMNYPQARRLVGGLTMSF